MAGQTQGRGKRADQKSKAPGKGTRTCGPKKSLNLSVSAGHHVRFKALALLLGREPGELMMSWIDEKTVGMRFSLPGLDAVGDKDGGPGVGGGDGSGEGLGGPSTYPLPRQVG